MTTNNFFKKQCISSFGIVIFIAFWEIMSTCVIPEKSTLPSPLSVFHALKEMWHSGELTEDVIASLNRIFFGFSIAFFSAVFFGIIAARYARIYDFVKMAMDLLSSIPPIAWTPVAILWFGIGNAPAYFIVFLGAFFPMFTGIYTGVTTVSSEMVNAAKTLGASRSHVVKAIVFPFALPQILTGIRTGIGVAWFNVINRNLLFSEHVVGLMFVIGILGFLMTRLIGVIGNIATPWAIQDDTRPRWMKFQRQFVRVWHSCRIRLQGANVSLGLIKHEYIPMEASQSESKREPILAVNNLSKSFQGQASEEKLDVIKNVSFIVNPYEVFSILGPNGSGKTTIINIIAGLLGPDGGSVEFMGNKVETPSHQRTVVFQNFALFPWRTCSGNIMFALNASKEGTTHQTYAERSKLTAHFLKEANLSEFADTYPSDLSGGMKQRLALVRALAVSPRLILMDEPFASFDPVVREKSQETILDLLSNRSTTILLVTHDLDEAIFMSDRILVLSKRPGRTKDIIEVDLPRPRLPEMRKSQPFHELRTRLWELLRD